MENSVGAFFSRKHMWKQIKEYRWNIIFFSLLGVLTIIITLLIISFKEHTQQTKDIVGGVFIGSVKDGGWNESHYNGLSMACEELDIELITEEYVAEETEAVKEAVDDLTEKGATIIFLTSNGYGDNVREVVESYPNISFYTVSSEAYAANENTYFARMYQARYLSGMLAAKYTKTNILGFVAGISSPQVNRGINAFLLGARSVNPEVVVKVRFTDSWLDAEAEKEAARKLVEEDGADVLAYHVSESTTVSVAEDLDVYSVGYSIIYGDYSDKLLCNVDYRWDVLYREMIQDYLKGYVAKSTPYWKGISEGAVAIDRISPIVDENTKNLLLMKYNSIDGIHDVFMDEIYDNEGNLRCNEGERISDGALLFDMNWFVEGVEICE